jgi:hypothetical protein
MAVGTGTTKSLEANSTRVSWEFIGDSSPDATVEGARRWAISACTTKLHSTAGFVLRAVKRRSPVLGLPLCSDSGVSLVCHAPEGHGRG